MQCKFDFRCDGSVIHNYNFPVWLLRWKVEYDNLNFYFFVNVVVKVGLACQDTEPKGSNTSFLLGKPERSKFTCERRFLLYYPTCKSKKIPVEEAASLSLFLI